MNWVNSCSYIMSHNDSTINIIVLLARRCLSLAIVSANGVDLSPIPSVGRSVCLCVRKVYYCGKTADWIRMPFGMVCGIGQGMGILDWVGNRRRKGAVLEDEFGTSHCNQWGLCCIVVRETRSSQITCYNTDCSEA